MFGGIESILDWSHQTASVILTRDASHTALAGGDGDGVEQASSFITLHVQAQVCYFLQLSKYEAKRGDRTSLKQMSTRQIKINGI